ncbi:PREDICTED: gem-associated protein 5 [Ceratosolen solmsi marchali]|uniref:Gem-associated protein 5 n=1 Tax=Ceratosolen solmsi marchali TaxID=326594 RepID=A0AAJ6YK68_9HYME|nr:PREDICTED: gem-associated protein 5 [Ceratosolen solmsi marchali]
MNEVTLPPSPNWFSSTILACASDGTIAWGAKNSIIIAKAKDNKQLDYSIIEKAHYDRVSTIAFSPTNIDNNDKLLVSGGNDNIVKIWNLNDLSLKLENNKLDETRKVIAVDWSKNNPNLICFISETGLLVTWNIDYNISQLISLGKLAVTCLACCPHDGNIVSIGCKNGLIYIVDICGSGNIKYKLRGHDVEIVSLSWCPVPINIFDEKNSNELLLASGAKDRVIFLWKAGSDGRYETQLTFPVPPLDPSNYKSKINSSSANFTAVNWLTPTHLFTSSPWGELLLWDLTKNAKKKFNPILIHGKHGKGLFSIAGLSKQSKEECENNKNENWRLKTNNAKTIWTVAQNRQVICCSILQNEITIEHSIPTQGGFVYCMSACPVDTSQIAFGTGDMMIRLWNLSEPHENIMELQMFWEKIKGKVRSLCWHPEKENILAFATNEGRVGTFDINSKRPPTIYRMYHRYVIYRIGWGPAPNVQEYALYTCGDGELVYYNPEAYNNTPIPVTKKKECTDFCWKPDYSLLALGFGDGSLSFLKPDLSEYEHTIHTLCKAVQCIAWHPESTLSDLNISTMNNYVAVAVNGPEIVVFEIYNINNSEDCKSNKLSFYKTVATLNGHSEKVVCLAWSPHISGYLVSGSYDYTAQVWKVETQEIIATYISHLGPIQCCMWSPYNHNLIITGSVDFTLRIWNISKHKALKTPSTMRTSTKYRQRTKKKKTAAKAIEAGSEKADNQLKSTVEGVKEVGNLPSYSKESDNMNKNNCKMLKKKKTKKITRFPHYAEIASSNKLWCSSIRNLLNSLKINHSNEGPLDHNETEKIPNNEPQTLKSNENNYVLLGTEKNLENSLKKEKNILFLNGQHNVVTEIDLWCDNLMENLHQAMKEKRLSDFLVSLAPAISIETWKIMCEAYATQLVFEENPHKAVSYLLCINKVHKAIDIFITEKLYKEAYALASSKLDAKDPIIKNILIEWATNAVKDGHFQNATECYIKLGQYTQAAKILERRKDFYSLLLAVDVAEVDHNIELSEAIADKAILESLLNGNVNAAKSVITNYYQIQYREVEVEIFIQLNKILDTINDEDMFYWLKGLSNISLLETLRNKFTKCPNKYSLLLQKDVFPLETNDVMVQINVSHQLALFILSDQQNQHFKHILKALDIISQFETINSTVSEEISLLMKYLFILDNKNLENVESIFNTSNNVIAESLRAYLCHGIIKWFQQNKLQDDQVSECKELVIKVLEKCIKDLFHIESFKYWKTLCEIPKLETQLSTRLGKLQDTEDNNVDSVKDVIERLDQLKLNKKEFLDQRISSPNPLFSYTSVKEFIGVISDDTIRNKIDKLLTETWTQIIS